MSSRKRHPDAWKPEYIWRILRLNESYQKAVNDFIRGAKKDPDRRALEIFERVSGCIYSDESKTFSFKRNKAKKVLVRNRKGRTKERTREAVVFSSYDSSHFEKTLQDYDIYTALDWQNFITDKPYLARFISKYGDVLRFPIHFDGDLRDIALSNLWIFLPATLGTTLDLITSPLTLRIDLTLNKTFDPATIADEAKNIVYDWVVLRHKKGVKNRVNIKWDDFKSYVEVYEANHQLRLKGIEPKPKQIFEHLKLNPEAIPGKPSQWVNTRVSKATIISDLFNR